MATSGARDIKYKAFAGLRNDIAPERFSRADLTVATNVNIDKTGCVSRRAGYVLRAAGPAHSLWTSGALALFVSGTQLKRLEPSYASTVLGTVSGAATSYCRVNDTVYLSDTVACRAYAGGALRSWGLAVPPTPTAALLAGDMQAGRYQFAVTYARADGQESGCAVAGSIDVPTGNTLRLTLANSSDPAVTAKNVYISPPDGDTLYFAAAVPAATTTFTASASAVSFLNLPLATQFLSPPPPGQIVGFYRGRMLVAAGSVLFMSEPFAYELFDMRNYIDLDGTITLLAPIEDRAAPGLFVGTTKSCGVLLGTGPEDFTYLPKTEYGAVPGTLVYVDGTLIGEGLGARQLPMWMTVEGICVGMPMAEIINHTYGRYEVGASGTGAGLFITEFNRYVVVTTTSCTAMRGETFAMSTYSNFAFNSLAMFGAAYLGGKADGIYELVGDTDAGAPIAATVTTGISDFGSSFIKSMDRLYVGYYSFTDMTFAAVADGETSAPYTLRANASGTVRGDRVKLGKGLAARYWQMQIQNTAGGAFELDLIEAGAVERLRRIRSRA